MPKKTGYLEAAVASVSRKQAAEVFETAKRLIEAGVIPGVPAVERRKTVFGTILHYLPTGDYAMVICRAPGRQWTRTMSLNDPRNSSGHEPGDIMDIADFAIGSWMVVES